MEQLFAMKLSRPCLLFMMWRNRMSVITEGGGGCGREVQNWLCHYNHSTLLHRYVIFVKLSPAVQHQAIIFLLSTALLISLHPDWWNFKVRKITLRERKASLLPRQRLKKCPKLYSLDFTATAWWYEIGTSWETWQMTTLVCTRVNRWPVFDQLYMLLTTWINTGTLV